jgi:hypothetical protein
MAEEAKGCGVTALKVTSQWQYGEMHLLQRCGLLQ